MQLIRRINLKFFIPLSLAVTGIHLAFCKSQIEVITILVIYLATLVNLAMLMYAVGQIVASVNLPPGKKLSKWKLVFAFLTKLFVLMGALTLGVQFIGNKIIIAIFNYVAQIFVLGVTMRRSTPGTVKR